MNAHHSDADVEQRIVSVAKSRTFSNLVDIYGLAAKRCIDIGCGYGEYLLAFGKGSIGITTTAGEVDFGARHDIDIRLANAEDIDVLDVGTFDAAWANNLFEHLIAPHAFLMQLRACLHSDGLVVLGVPVVPVMPALTRLRWFRGVLASNHINFFTRHTLRLTVERAGYKVLAARPFIFRSHLLDVIVAPFAPHIYVVAKPINGFTYPEKKVKEWVDDPRYRKILASGGYSNV